MVVLSGITRVAVSSMVTGPPPQWNLIVAPPTVAAITKASPSAVSVQLAAVPLPTKIGGAARAGCDNATRANTRKERWRVSQP